jgi:ubiquinone biosynthesis protein
VFKVLKPGIEERLEQELELLGPVGSYLDQRCDEFRIPPLDYRESFQQLRDKLRHEVRLDLEQHHLAQARAFYEGEPRVLIPALFDCCTPRVTAMERVRGRKVTEPVPDSGGEPRRRAGLLIEALVAQPFFSKASQAMFHGDPHAGNLFLTEDRRLALLDWSLAGSLGERERIAVVQILVGALTLNAERIVTALSGLDEHRRIDQHALGRVVDAWLTRLRPAGAGAPGRLPGFTWVLGLLDEAVQTARLRVGADLMLFRKALHTLEGVLGGLGAGDGRIDGVLLREFLRHLAVEWPERWLVPPDCRAFATRLSNADLAGLTLGLPWTMFRLWLDSVLRCTVRKR